MSTEAALFLDKQSNTVILLGLIPNSFLPSPKGNLPPSDATAAPQGQPQRPHLPPPPPIGYTTSAPMHSMWGAHASREEPSCWRPMGANSAYSARG